MPLTTLPEKAVRKMRNLLTPGTRWEPLLRREKDLWNRLKALPKASRVLIATSSAGHEAVTPVESLVGTALTARGAEVRFLVCDAVTPACQLMTYPDVMQNGKWSETRRRKICTSCRRRGSAAYDALQLPLHRFSEFLTPSDSEERRRLARSLPLAEIRTYREDGLEIGEQAYAGALRFFARGSLEGEPQEEAVVRRYFEAALLARSVMERYLDQHPCDAAVFHHGIYVPQGVIAGVLRRRGVRVVNWNLAYRKKRVIFSHQDTYHHTLLAEPSAAWESLPWTRARDLGLTDYLESRKRGRQDWISFYKEPAFPGPEWRRKLGMNPEKPFALLLTNVIWDAQLHYPANAFPDMLSWIFESIDYFSRRPELELVIRIHPAEIRGLPVSRQRVYDEIQKRFLKLPGNVFVIQPENPLSTYRLAEDCNVALIYGTKTGVELAARGIPLVVAGEAWIREKGLSLDASSREEYLKHLDLLPLTKDSGGPTRERARRYAYHFFFRRMIPLRSLQERRGVWPPVRAEVKALKDVLPGADPGLDVICHGILDGADFIYPAEEYDEACD